MLVTCCKDRGGSVILWLVCHTHRFKTVFAGIACGSYGSDSQRQTSLDELPTCCSFLCLDGCICCSSSASVQHMQAIASNPHMVPVTHRCSIVADRQYRPLLSADCTRPRRYRELCVSQPGRTLCLTALAYDAVCLDNPPALMACSHQNLASHLPPGIVT